MRGSLLCLSLLAAGAAATGPPGLWFWGGASPESLAAIKAFSTDLKSKAPTAQSRAVRASDPRHREIAQKKCDGGLF